MKSEPIQTNDPNLTAFAIGEMSPSEALQFERNLQESPEAQAELADIEETIGWLRDGFTADLFAPRIADQDLTAFALNELDESKSADIAQQIEKSPKAKSELADIEETIGWLKNSYAAEVSDARITGQDLTAFALGELDDIASSEIEDQVKNSPKAQAEVTQIKQTAGWLQEGYSAQANAPRLLADVASDDKIITGDFKKPGFRVMLGGLAAVLVGLLAVGGLISRNRATGDGQLTANVPTNRVEAFQPVEVEVPSALPEQESFFAIPEVEKVGANSMGGNGIMLANYEPVDGMMVPSLAAFDNTKLPGMLEVAAFNEGGGSFGPANPLSYIKYDNLAPTDIIEIKSDSLNSKSTLPGIDAIGKGKASFGTYKFQNEESKNLPEDEFGHGELSFEIRTRIVNGKVIETVRLVDTRKGPDGKETKTVKEFVREGADVGKPIESLLPEAFGQPQSSAPAANTGNILPINDEAVEIPTIGDVTPMPVNPMITEFFMINTELSAVRDALATDPTGSELEALQTKLSDLIKQQAALGRKLEANIGM